MMTNRRAEEIVRQHIRKILREEGDGGFGGDYGWGGLSTGLGGGWGMGYGIGKDLGKFLDPFVDVFKIATGATKELTRRALTIVSVAGEAILTTLIPWLADDYGKIFAKEREDVQKIRDSYREAMNSVWEAFKYDDFLVTAFMYAPAEMLASTAARYAPEVTGKALSVLSGGTLDGVLDKIFDKYAKGPEWKTYKRFATGVADIGASRTASLLGAFEGVVREKKDVDNKKQSLESVLSNKKLIAAAGRGQVARKMSAATHEIVDNALKQAQEQAAAALAAQNLADIEKMTGKKLPEKFTTALKKAQPQERQKIEQSVLAGLKKSMKAFYIKGIKDQVQRMIDAGVPSSHSLVRAYEKTASAMNAM